MEQGLVAIGVVLSFLAGWLGWRRGMAGDGGGRSLPLLAVVFLLFLMALGLRGEMRGACPLRDPGEVVLFLGWSLVFFYLLVGPAYRLSLLGVFTAPVVGLLGAVSLLPGMFGELPPVATSTSGIREAHAALSMLSFGALGLAAVAGVMFLVLNGLLKRRELAGGFFQSFPPVRHLVTSMKRLLVIGVLLLSLGVAAGWMVEGAGGRHWWAALVVWLSYLALGILTWWRGMSGRSLALWLLGLFAASWVIFVQL